MSLLRKPLLCMDGIESAIGVPICEPRNGPRDESNMQINIIFHIRLAWTSAKFFKKQYIFSPLLLSLYAACVYACSLHPCNVFPHTYFFRLKLINSFPTIHRSHINVRNKIAHQVLPP
jgi:hypothetical protein